ncbi:eCIS core domain-containing protein [Rheinheimera soli]|uniref:eCIS core domain-containing protein n=1 Tax=Rheinheimera soli TaxID=443616 RepID=UPI001E51AE4F|nr:DUF4157 domain-containing protein [Rheinheimera soli]
MAEFKVEHKKQQSSEHGTVSQRKGTTVLPDHRSQVSQAHALSDNRAVQLVQNPSPKPNNTGLPNQLKAGIESLSGLSMDHVKVHYNSAKPAQLNAHAYAQGSEIHLGAGQEKHLPHEAWHVVQQAQGRVKPTMQMKAGVGVNDDVGLEKEADVMGAKALQRKTSNAGIPKLTTPALRTTPLQRAATVSDAMKIAEKIKKGKEKNSEGPTTHTAQKKKNPRTNPDTGEVVQRLVNAPISLNNPYTFMVVPADLGTGTVTTPGTRTYVNNPATPKFPTVSFSYAFYPPGAAAPVAGAAPGPLANIPNPPPGAGNYDAGHSLGRQNGGRGDLNNWVFPQDAIVNRGWGGTFGIWRAHENAFNAGVAALGPGGFGVWHVQLP